MERLTEWRDGHGSLLHGDGYTRLAEYEDIGMEPAEIEKIIDRFGRGLTLRSSIARKVDLIEGISEERLKEIVAAEKSGRLVIKPEPLDATCGSCIHFKREAGTAHGNCDCRVDRILRNPLYVTQGRTRCRDDYKKVEEK